jgi:hypothetical protein
LLVLGLTTTACATSPLNHATLATKATQVTFQGFVGIAGTQINILALNTTTNQFDLLGSTKADGAQPKTDALGIAWYPWITKLTLPQGSQYWAEDANQLRVKVMADTAGGPLVTFDDGALACWSKQLAKGGTAVVAHCKSLESPVVTLTTPCDKSCCAGIACASGAQCSGGVCQSCGGAAQPCCAGSAGSCSGGASCQNNGKCPTPPPITPDCVAFGEDCGVGKNKCCPGNLCHSTPSGGWQCCKQSTVNSGICE